MTKVPQMPPKNETKPDPSPPPPRPGENGEQYTARTGVSTIKAIPEPQWSGFIVRVPLVCPHCSSYMHVLPSGSAMTCHTERCVNHLRKFRLPRLIAEEIKD